MSVNVRLKADRGFTFLTYVCVAMLALMLIGILGPMIWRGSSAVFFDGTVEFRKMQMFLFDRESKGLDEQTARTAEVRAEVYEIIDSYKRGMDPEKLSDRVTDIYREYGQKLRYEQVERSAYTERRRTSRQMREDLEQAFFSNDLEQIEELVSGVLAYRDDPRFEGTVIEQYFQIGSEYLATAGKVDLSRRQQYQAEVDQLDELIAELLGPRPGQPEPALAQMKFGATRWDQVQDLLGRINYSQSWVEVEPGQPLEKKLVSRKETFAGTKLEKLFVYLNENIEAMMAPQFTFYWQYFIDDSTPGHYFGGVGPEILGTLLVTCLSMLFAVPIGVVTAAYLVECAGDNYLVRVIRMCINTLAGVPSIVFGLFGLAFFVLFLFPRLGAPSKPCMLAASLTLAVLTLPVVIRASEEAIRSVPGAYREASLGLGASKLTTFMRVTLPAAMPGILTGVILSLSRVAGETAPILFTGAVALGPVPDSLFDPTRTLSYGSYDMAVGDRLAMRVPHNQFGMVVTLILLILLLNAISIVLRSRVEKSLRGH